MSFFAPPPYVLTLARLKASLGELLPTRGDTLKKGATEVERLALGATYTFPQSDGTDPAYGDVAALLTQLGGSLPAKGNLLMRRLVGGGPAVAFQQFAATNQHYALYSNGADAELFYGPSARSVLTAAGDLLTASAANTLARLALGTDGKVVGAAGGALGYRTATLSWYQVLSWVAPGFDNQNANFPDPEIVGTNLSRFLAAFDQTTVEYADLHEQTISPDVDTSGNVIGWVRGRAKTAAASKNVAFTLEYLVVGDGQASDPASPWTTMTSGDKAISGTQGHRDRLVIDTIAATQFAANKGVKARLSRQAPSASNLLSDYYVEACGLLVPCKATVALA